ncbi:MAG: hypothetical protein ACI9LO_003411 [Planctomycetota bacterium]|jgi:hypothetical protein
MTGPYRGSCLCGEIAFEVDELGSTIGNCHCSMCRKFHGPAYATLAEVEAEHFRWLRGKESLKILSYESPTRNIVRLGTLTRQTEGFTRLYIGRRIRPVY